MDVHYLLSLPDGNRRIEILYEIWAKNWSEEQSKGATKKTKKKKAEEFRESISLDHFKKAVANIEGMEKIRDNTVFLGWGDLRRLSKQVTFEKPDVEAFAKDLSGKTGQASPSTSLGAYRTRFDGRSEPATEEFFLLLYLLADARKPTYSESQAIGDIFDEMKDFKGKVDELYEEGRGTVKSKIVVGKVQKTFSKLLADFIKRKTTKSRKRRKKRKTKIANPIGRFIDLRAELQSPLFYRSGR